MLTAHTLHQQLADAGVRCGSALVVHSSFRSVGPVEGGAGALLDGLLAAVGEDGLLVMPTFTYANGGEAFNPASTPSRTGILGELLRQLPDAERSLHPTHSVAAHGRHARDIVKGHLQSGACGIGSPLDLAAGRDAQVLLLGVSHTANTMIHIGEAYAGIKKFPAWEKHAPERSVILSDGSRACCTAETSASCSFAFNALDLTLRRRRAVQDLYIGTALSELIPAREIIAATMDLLRQEPEMLICTRPDCIRCQRRREFLQAGGRDPEPQRPAWFQKRLPAKGNPH